MDARRFVIGSHQWARMQAHGLGLKAHPKRTGSDPRLFMEAVFWTARSGVFAIIFKDLYDQPEMKVAMIPPLGHHVVMPCRAADGTLVKVHRAGQGAKGRHPVRP
ncbi:MAG: hypothetical protein CR993_03015 [Rhodobacterales bacterium]|nr:MAG: hypothetical protein CR993_03015 [Rhodobacterales bacterium]